MIADARQFADAALIAAASLLPIVNPLGSAPVFLLKTADLDSAERALMARRVAQNSFLLLLASVLIGAYVLDFMSLSVGVVRIAGGLVVCSIAWSLLTQDEPMAAPARDAARVISPEAIAQRAFYPLTMPLTVGPGSISVAITLGANQPSELRQLILIIVAHAIGVLAVTVAVYLCYRYADRVLARLGRTGTSVLLRLSAFILLCIGVQIIFNGGVALMRMPSPA
ncbi:MAG TPA: MarC family protein [Casimicrobiaceae bacterium]|jgi:multiple antibiotic resistance protein|nr:MarC family protein [Casimicrobiaceae bacterium]